MVKACNQIVVAVTIAAVSEALVLGSKAGVDPAHILDVLAGGLAANRVMEVRRRNFLEHDFTPGFRIDLHHKDLDIALESGDAYGVPLPVTGMVQQGMRALRARGHGGDDHSGLLQLVEELAAHRIGEPPTGGLAFQEAHRARQELGRGGDGAQGGRLDAGHVRELHDRADDRRELERLARLEVLQRGGLVLADPLGAGQPALDRDLRRGADRAGDVERLGHHSRDESARVGS